MNEREFEEAVRVVRGNPTDAELAAVIAVIEAEALEAKALSTKSRRQPTSTWNRSSVNLRGGINPGFGQWRASYRDGLN